MVPPQRALQLGLVDELEADTAQLLTRAEVSNVGLMFECLVHGLGFRV
jgi:hypothetical protein